MPATGDVIPAHGTEDLVMGNPSALAGLLLLLGVASSSPSGAQTPGLVSGAYERMDDRRIAHEMLDQHRDVLFAKRAELEYLRAADERRVHREEWVLSRCPNQDDPAGLNVRQEDILLGTVKAVDLDKKTVTVEGSKGRVETIDAKEARNLDQVKVGDKVTVTYTQALAVFVRKGDEPPSTSENQTVQLAPKGEKPGGVVARTVQLTGTIQSVDAKKRMVDVRVPAGDVRTFKVDPRVKNLSQVKKGDQVVLRYTESVALSVVKP